MTSKLLVGYSKFLKNTLPQDTAIYWNTIIISKYIFDVCDAKYTPRNVVPLYSAQPAPLSVAALTQMFTWNSFHWQHMLFNLSSRFRFFKGIKLILKNNGSFKKKNTRSLKLLCALLPFEGFFLFYFTVPFSVLLSIAILHCPIGISLCHFFSHLWHLYWTVLGETVCFQNCLVLCYVKRHV